MSKLVICKENSAIVVSQDHQLKFGLRENSVAIFDEKENIQKEISLIEFGNWCKENGYLYLEFVK
jgi:hypothetical protein